ncbi:MAG: hypothetical protein JWN22_2731, partial [Nocardioides sp.]|nr:hypothetical protein [Nocardioides sp.]
MSGHPAGTLDTSAADPPAPGFEL